MCEHTKQFPDHLARVRHRKYIGQVQVVFKTKMKKVKRRGRWWAAAARHRRRRWDRSPLRALTAPEHSANGR